jgi:predicted DNA-binding protein
MKRRGGYPGNLERQIKVRVARETYDKLQRLAEEKDKTVARIIRGFISTGLGGEKTS